MAAPTVLLTYPADGDTGIPVGETLVVKFDNYVDEQTVIDSLILHGADFDFVTGAGSTNFIREDGAANPFFLTSPGFSGVAPLDVTFFFYDLGTGDDATPDPADLVDEAAFAASGLGHGARIRLAPEFNAQLAPDTRYTLTIVGDPASKGLGLSTRTVYPASPVTVTGDGFCAVAGTFTGIGSDVLHVKVTRAGDVNSTKFKYWYESVGEGGAIAGRITATKYRLLEAGIKIRFYGDNFLVDDEWAFSVGAAQRLAESYQVVFITNDGMFSTAPDSPSTPAESSPPDTVLPGVLGDDSLSIVSMTPVSGTYGNTSVNEIVIVFNKTIDAGTITPETLKLFSYPVEGLYEYTTGPRPLAYAFDVDDNVLTIRI